VRCALLFGKSVRWYQKVGDEVMTVNAIVPLGWSFLGNSVPGTSEGASYADVFLRATNASSIEELKSIAKTLRIRDSRSSVAIWKLRSRLGSDNR
jgi:hypothetical protein